MSRSIFLTVLTVCVSLCIVSQIDAEEVANVDGLAFFEKKIRPVLIEHCYECHAADAKNIRGGLLVDHAAGIRTGGDSGAAVVPRSPSEGTLLDALRYETFEMPPKQKLPERVIKDFETWINMGAPDPRTETISTKEKPEIDLEEGQQFWSFQPISNPEVPIAKDSNWSRNSIDHFVLDRLTENDLHPVQDADQLTLLRRLYFDLIGLPPTVAQIEEFLAADSETRVVELVDQLLNSPEFGRRWGRHWLDLARYSDSTGGGRSMLYGPSWRYRNYVIESFNNDKPYDTFIKEQIAGDLLEAENHLSRQAQITATGFLALGPHNYENQDKEQLRMDVVDEQIDTVGRVFLAMTIGCARCHDHKFDPIPTTDYYALAGIFRSTNSLVDGNVSKWVTTELPLDAEVERRRREEFLTQKSKLSEQLNRLKSELADLNSQSQTFFVDNDEAKLKGEWKSSSSVKGFVGSDYQYSTDPDSSATYSIRTDKDVYHIHLNYTPHGNRTTKALVTIEHSKGFSEFTVDQTKEPSIIRSFLKLGEFQSDGKLKITIRPSEERVTVIDYVTLGRALRLKDLGLGTQIQAKTKEVEELQTKLDDLEKNGPQLGPKAISVEEFPNPSDYNVCIRGNVHNLGEPVERGFLSVISSAGEIEIPDDRSGRLELANWIASAKNPLTARVMVNRIWHHLFGVGLVRTVDNFGVPGETPSHPELLDHLAQDFVKNGWSIKNLIRTIVLSRTYQLASDGPQTDVDPENRLLAHQNRRRLTAEAIHDSLLFISQSLDLSETEDSLRPGTKAEYGYQFDFGKRAVYLPTFRNRLPDLFTVFDFPDPNLSVGRRSTSTISPQALFLTNSEFINEHSQATAERVLKLEGDAESRLRWLVLAVLNREPTSDEIRLLTEFLGDEIDSPQRWTAVVKSLFGSLDFRFLN